MSVKRITASMPQYMYDMYLEPYEADNMSQRIQQLVVLGSAAEINDLGLTKKRNVELVALLEKEKKKNNILSAELGRFKDLMKKKKENKTLVEVAPKEDKWVKAAREIRERKEKEKKEVVEREV